MEERKVNTILNTGMEQENQKSFDLEGEKTSYGLLRMMQ